MQLGYSVPDCVAGMDVFVRRAEPPEKTDWCRPEEMAQPATTQESPDNVAARQRSDDPQTNTPATGSLWIND